MNWFLNDEPLVSVLYISVICIYVTNMYLNDDSLRYLQDKEQNDSIIEIYMMVLSTWMHFYDNSKVIFSIPILLMIFYATKYMDIKLFSNNTLQSIVMLKSYIKRDVQKVAPLIQQYLPQIISIFRLCSPLSFIQPVTVCLRKACET